MHIIIEHGYNKSSISTAFFLTLSENYFFMNSKLYLIAFISLLLTNHLAAQTSYTTNEVGHISKGADVNFAEIAKYYKEHPTPLVRKPLFNEEGDEDSRPEHPAMDPSMVHLIKRDAARNAESPHSAYLPVSVSPTDTFQGSKSDGTTIPPDTHGCVDSTYCVMALNDSIVIKTRAGVHVYGVTLDHFWASVMPHGTASGGAYDPRVHYDPHYKRWIMICDAYGQSTYSQIMVGISATGDPTGTWHLYNLVVGGASGNWLDFPCAGFNKRWVAVSGNFFTTAGSFTNDVIYVFDYASMMVGGTLSYGTLLPTGGSFTACPAQTYDTSEANMFTMESWNGTSGALRLCKITGAIGAGLTISGIGYPTTSTHWQGAANSTSADFAPQLGTANKLQTNDDRVNNLVQRNGKLWCAHTAFLPSSGVVTRASAMWWQIDTNSTPAQNGLINDPTNAIFYFFPSISVNKNNDALIGFAYTSASIHPSCGYALHMNFDPNDSTRPPFVYRHGQSTYYQTFGGGQNRWGDYSNTCVDPRNDLDFWTLQETTPTTANIWDTWWAYVRVCSPPASPVLSVSPASQCTGSSAWYAVDTVTGATSYTWTVSGTGWSGSSTTDSVSLLAGSGVATVSVTANNSCSPSTAYTFTITPSPLPVEVISPATPPVCISAATAGFSAASIGSPTSFSWTVLGSGWSGSSTTSFLTATLGTGTGTIIVNGTNGCGTGPNDTLLVIPSSGPATPTVIHVSSPLCSSSTATFSTPAVSYAIGYAWTIIGTGWSGSSTTDTIIVTTGTGTGTIIVNVTDACGTSGNDTLLVTPGTVPSAATSITVPSPLCVGSTVAFSTPSIAGASSYTWSVSGTGWSGSSTTSSINVTIGTGAGTITVTPVDSCGSGTPFTLSGIAPQIAPTAPFSVSTHATHTNTNVVITYTGTGGSGSTYTWNFNTGVATPGGTSPGPQSVHWTTPGTYTVTLTVDSAGCSSTYTDTVHVSAGVGVQQINSQTFNANIVPNPNNGSFDIVFDQPVNQLISVKVIDMQGRIVYSNEFNETNNNKLMIATSGLPSGTYAASIYIDGNVLITKKITINK